MRSANSRCAMSWMFMVGLLMGVGLLLLATSSASARGLGAVQAATKLCFPVTPNEPQGDQTTLYLTNAGASPATVTVVIYRQDGSPAANTHLLQILPGATQAFSFSTNPDIATGLLHTIVGASEPVVGVAHVRNSVTGLVGVYQAVECSQASDTLFGPYAGGTATASSALYLLNGSAAAATVQPVFVSLAGTAVYTPPPLSLAPGAVAVISDNTLPAGVTLPPDVYTIEIATATPGVFGVLATTVGGATTFADALAHNVPVTQAIAPAQAYLLALPRLYVRENIGGTAFSTNMLVRNTAAALTVLNMSFYKPDGTQGGPPMVDQLPAAGSKEYVFRSFFNLASGLYSIVIGSNYSLVLQAEVAADDPATATYGADSFVVQPASTRLLLPGMVYNGDVFTIVAAQNLAGTAANVTVDLLGAQGNIVATVQGVVYAGAALSMDLRAVAGLPADFAGAALITSDQQVIAQVDTFSHRIVGTPPASIAITGPHLVQEGPPVSFTAVVSPTDAATPITYTWQATDLAPSVRVSTSISDVVMLGWNLPGTKSIVVTATNAAGSASAEYSVEVGAAPNGVALTTGPDQVQVGEAAAFTATVSPPEAGTPITFTWEAEGLPTVVRVSFNGVDAVAFTWPEVGTKTVRVTAANRWGAASVEASVRVEAVTIAGPRLVPPGQPVSFRAVVSPADFSKPITFTWYADDLPVTVHVVNGNEDQVTLTWTAAGRKTVVVKATNQLGTIRTAHTVEVPVAAVVTTEEPFSVTATAPEGWGVALGVPAGGASAGYTLTVTPVAVQQVITGEEPITGINLLGVAVVLQAYSGDQLLPGFVFDQPATLVFRYSDVQAGHSETTLRIFTLQGDTWIDAAETCDPKSEYVRRPEQNELAVNICHLSPYVMGEPAVWYYVPLIRK